MKTNIRIIFIFVCILLCALCALPFTACEKTEDVQSGTSYSIWLDISEDKIECTQKTTFVNNSEYPLDELIFNVYANAYSLTSPLPCTPQEEADAYAERVKMDVLQYADDMLAYLSGNLQSALQGLNDNRGSVNEERRKLAAPQQSEYFGDELPEDEEEEK